MKLLSKQVVAGLLVGAMSLSSFTVGSFAAPDANKYYQIKLKSDLNKVWDVVQGEQGNNQAILLYEAHKGDNQKFMFFPLDGDLYAIVNKNSGKVVRVSGNKPQFGGDAMMDKSEVLTQNTWTGAADQQWYFRDLGGYYYEIVNQGYGKVASYAYTGNLISNAEFVDLDNSNPSDDKRVFSISTFNDSITLPTLPTIGERPAAPDYDYYGDVGQKLPKTTTPVVVGASLVPCIMVNDGQTSDYTKIHTSPYYTLVKEEYWDQVYTAVIPSGATNSYTFKTGVTNTDQQKMTYTLSMKIGADLGLKFSDQTAALKFEIARTIQTEVSTTSAELSETTVQRTVTGEAGKPATGFTEYQLATKYSLYRQDGTMVSNPWVVKDNQTTVARKIVQGSLSGRNLALNKPITDNSEVDGNYAFWGFYPEKAVNGSVATLNDKWCAPSELGGYPLHSEGQYLKVDLGQNYSISRWVVKHAGEGGEDSGYNTRDFKLQSSADGITWVDQDVVMNNTSNKTDRVVTPFNARYVRLYITKPTNNNDTSTRIYEFEVYSN